MESIIHRKSQMVERRKKNESEKKKLFGMNLQFRGNIVSNGLCFLCAQLRNVGVCNNALRKKNCGDYGERLKMLVFLLLFCLNVNLHTCN